jgi:hypothetical protein
VPRTIYSRTVAGTRALYRCLFPAATLENKYFAHANWADMDGKSAWMVADC